jgi:hypothetical protein
LKIQLELCDVEHEGDIEQVRQAISNAGGSLVDYDHHYDAELLICTIECTNSSNFLDFEWMGTEVPIENQGDGLGGALI